MPILNGRRHDWASMQMVLPSLGQYPVTLQSVTYPKHSVPKEDVHGTGIAPIGHTIGQYSVEGLEVEFLASEWDEIRATLGAGYLGRTLNLPITFVYVDTDLTARSDEFVSCNITDEQPVVAKDGAMTNKITFKPQQMILNGVPAILALRA